MGRNNAQTLNNISMLCRIQKIEEKLLYGRAKLILSIYRDVCWSVDGRAEEVHDELICICGSDLHSALVYLETFAPDEARERFEERIRSLFETKWIIELVENTMLRVRDYPCRGDLYFEILSKCYLTRFKYRESELLELLGMERSTFYDRKKEAVMLFGLSFWGSSIPKLKCFLMDKEEIFAETVC